MSNPPEIEKAQFIEFVEDGCNPGLLAAAQEFATRWRGPRTRYSVHRMMKELIWPAWLNYLEAIPEYLRKLCKVLNHDDLKDPGGTIITIVRKARDIRYLDLARIEWQRNFEPTIGTLRNILEWCELVEYLKTTDNRVRAIRGRRTGTCTWKDENTGQRCPELTEYLAYLRGADVGVGFEKGLIQRLHERRCVSHAKRTRKQAKATSLVEKMKKQDKSSIASPDQGRGRGLCRMCGRLTERDAVQDFYHSSRGIVITATDSLSDRFCAEHVSTGPKYHVALLALEKYDDTRARLQKQSFHHAELKELHSNPAVNWFENCLVRQLRIFASQESDPRKRARHEVVWAISKLLPETDVVFNSEIEIVLDLLADGLKRHLNPVHTGDEPKAIWAVLRNLYSSDRPSFNRIAVLIFYSLGHDQKSIAQMFELQTRVVATLIRDITPTIVPGPEEATLGMATDYLVRQARISERQMEIVYWKSQKEKDIAIAKRLRVSRQAVSKALQGIPNNLRFDIYSR